MPEKPKATDSPYNADAEPGDPDFRPGPDFPPALGEIAWTQGVSVEVLAEKIRRDRLAR